MRAPVARGGSGARGEVSGAAARAPEGSRGMASGTGRGRGTMEVKS